MNVEHRGLGFNQYFTQEQGKLKITSKHKPTFLTYDTDTC